MLDDVVGVRESVTDMRRSMGQLVRHLREEADASAAEVKALRSATETLKTEIQNREVRLDNAVQRVQDTFAETQATRATEFQKLVQRLEDEWKQSEETREDLVTDAIQTFETASQAAVAFAFVTTASISFSYVAFCVESRVTSSLALPLASIEATTSPR